jgi:hypothetical protein
MDEVKAQTTSVVRVKALFSEEEVEKLLSSANAMPATAAVADKDTQYRQSNSLLPGEFTWNVKYIHTEGYMQVKMAGVLRKLREAVELVDRREGWGLLEGKDGAGINVRTAEYHSYGKGGGLGDPHHCDHGSLVTVDVMLHRPGMDFEGGAFCTWRDGSVTQHTDFGLGDAVVFVSHKKHHVERVTSGVRKVLVMEFWQGPASVCPHRCRDPSGNCTFKTKSAPPKAATVEEAGDALACLIDTDLLADAMRALNNSDSESECGEEQSC